MMRSVSIGKLELELGLRHSETFCPFAMALGPLIPGHVLVTQESIEVFELVWEARHVPGTKGREWYRKQVPGIRKLSDFPIPMDAVDWISAYDSGRKMNPAVFQVDIPSF